MEGEVKKEMGLHYQHDGEFWMEFFVDFCREFEVREVVKKTILYLSFDPPPCTEKKFEKKEKKKIDIFYHTLLNILC